MERESKRKKLKSEEQQSPETKMAQNRNTRSSPYCIAASSRNNSEAMSTSPILDTTKIRRKGKFYTRRAVSDSAYSLSLAKVTKYHKIEQTSTTTNNNKNLETFLESKELTRCLSCNSMLDTNQKCLNCTDEKLASPRNNCLNESLGDRVRNLKRIKKSATRISDVKDMQIKDEEFVESIRKLDKASYLTSSKNVSLSPTKRLGLLPFVELECLRLSQMQERKNSHFVSHSPEKTLELLPSVELEQLRFSQMTTERNSLPAIHLSLDEDKEEDGDMFADTKDNVEVIEGLEEFSPRKHNCIDTSASSFHGFSLQECNSSRDIAEKGSQFQELNEVDFLDEITHFCGFPAEKTDKSENLLQDWKSSLRNNILDSKDWEDWFVEDDFVSNKVRENSKENMADSEKISKLFDQKLYSRTKCVSETASPKTDTPLSKDIKGATDTRHNCNVNDSPKSTSSSKMEDLPGPSRFSTDCTRPSKIFHTAVDKATVEDKNQRTTKRQYFEVDEAKKTFESPPKKKTKDMKNGCGVNVGFTTAGGRELKISEASWSKSKAIFDAIEEPCIANLAEKEKDSDSVTKKESKINVGFTTAGGRELKISEASWSKSKAIFEAIEEPCIANLAEKEKDSDSVTKNESKINVGFTTAGGRELKISEASWSKSKAIFDAIEEPCIANLAEKEKDSDSVTKNQSKINVGFTTAGGRELKISEASWSKSKAIFDAIEEPCIANLAEKEINSDSVTKNESKINVGFTTAGGRELKVSEASWSKSKAVFDAIEEPSIGDLAEKNKEPSLKTNIITSRNKTETMTSGFSTASGHSINITTEAISAAKAQFSSDWDNMESFDLEDFVDPIEVPEISKKRKVEDTDEETPLRRDSSLNRKRGRYVNDLQARKLFIEESNNEDEDKTTKLSSEFVGLNRVNTEKNLISEEVDASAAALLEDEERSNDGATWKISALTKDGSVSPELGCEINNRSRADVSTRNLLGALNRANLEKVNVVETSGDSRFSHAASGASINNEENNHRAASTEKREESQGIQHESIPDDLTFDSQFSQDIQRSPVIDKFIADTMKIMEGRLAMALKQDETIRGKRRIKPEASDGFLYRIRTSNRDSRISWKQLTEGIAPSSREISGDYLGRDLMSITANSAAHYSFRCADFYGEGIVRSNIEGIKIGDGALLILDEKNSAGAREFERAFLASPGVNPNLVPTGWIKNHYRWIVWKLASMDRVKFGHKILPRMLTPDRVMHELKYRYDREIYRTQWPPLRKMLERAEDISGRIVLCVSSIVAEKDENAPVKGANTPNSIGSTFYKMTLTDGWYSIGTSIDSAMINFIKSGKIREGTKLMVFGARAVNLDQGCSALEIPEAVTLRISSNSTRRAKWNAKLDFYRANRGPMSLNLKSIKPNGGTICKLIVAVSRVYPILYREKLPDGQFVFRNARCDEEAARDHEARYQSKMEEIYANAWSEFQISSMSRKSSGSAKKRSYTQEEVAACSKDMEEELRQRISSKMSECLPTPRDVTPVMKIRIAEDDTCALMTVWSTDRDTSEIFVEGSSIAIYNSFASGLRSSELQITASRCTFVKREESRRISYPERIYTSLTGITDPGFNPVYGEFDTIGIVSSTGPAPHGMKNFETVNFACPKPDDANESDFLSVLFWQGVSAHGYGKILTVGSLVACSNLEWRRNTSRSIPTAYCTERSVFSKNPRQSHLTHAFENLHKKIKEPLAYAAACATVIEEEIARKSALRTPGSVSGTPYRPATSNSRTPGWSPRDLTIDANCNTPRIDSKKTSTRKRLERLEFYGEAPALPSIVINNSSRKVLSEFRSPVTKP